MQRLSFSTLISAWAIGALFVTGPIVTTTASAHSQDMQNMPGMKMPKSKPKASRKAAPRNWRAEPRRRTAKKHDMGNRPGMNMPAQPSSSPKKSTAPQSSPQQMPMKMPGMQMPQATPSSSPQTQMNMPGMQMPSASPNSQSAP